MFSIPRLASKPLTSALPRLLSKTMATSSTAAAKHEWIVILPDHEGALPRRMEVRPKHLENLKPRIDANFWLFGGAFLEEVPKEGEGPKIKGSVMLAYAESKEEVLKALKEDIYFTSNVWDEDKIQIYPFRSAIRKPML